MAPVIERRLVLLRHAKSARPHGVPDHDRPLAGRGRRDAQAAGDWFVSEGPRPDLVLSSSAVRARQTWEIVCRAFPRMPRVAVEPRLYGARPIDVLRLARGADADVHVLLLVGHEPTLSETVMGMSGKGSDRSAMRAVRHKYPTTGIAVLRFRGPWAGLQPGGAVLESFVVPRG